MSVSLPAKGATETVDYVLDWSSRLDGDDQITSSTWTVPADLTQSALQTIALNGRTGVAVKFILAGGTAKQWRLLTNTITTTMGRTMFERVWLYITP